MKLALLGNDLDALALARAAAAAGHAVVWVADAPNLPEFDDCLAPVEQWEDLFDDDLADAVIVGRGSADPQLCSRRVQELVKQGRAVLTTFPLVPSVLSYFEIDMARGESGAAVRHFNPVLGSAPLELLRTALAGTLAELGTVESVTCERALADRSRENVMWHFARDVEMLDAVVGGLDRVGAHGGAGRGPDDPQAYAGLSVQLSGRDERPVRWNVVPAHGDPAMRVTLLGEQGRVTVVWDVAGRAVRATLHTGAGDKDFPLSESDAAARAIEELAAACGPAPSAARSTWGAALHAMELADTIEISLRRGRMIDVHGQQLTEQLAFRGTMAAAGCGLLLVLPPLLLAAGWIAGLLGVPVADYWPHALLGLLALFLAIQLLPRLVYPPESPRSESGDSDRDAK